MPTFSFAGNELGPAVSADFKEGGRVIDLCDEVGAPVLFSCRSASCGTCRIEILEGAEILEPAQEEEIEVLAVFSSPPSHRLACRAIARPGVGLVRIRWVSD